MDNFLSFDSLIGTDSERDFSLGDFSFTDSKRAPTRIMQPRMSKHTVTLKVKYDNAESLAKDLDLSAGCRSFVIVSGNFIFGDFIEALCELRGVRIKQMYISTLSMSAENIDSLVNIYDLCPDIEQLNVLLSAYFYSHEKHGLVPYLYSELDVGDRLQVCFCDTHCKIVLIETDDGRHFVAHGSANLRSSHNIEQFCWEEDAELYDFNRQYMDRLLRQYATINKSIRGGRIWQAVVAEEDPTAFTASDKSG